MRGDLLVEAYVFVLAVFVGFQLISKVPSVLHTPLMSVTNAIHGIILVGALALAATVRGPLQTAIAAFALVLATMNVVGGFVVTDRILGMFRGRKSEGSRSA
jgi:NAD(P) transhydrogenase subunit alpha